LYSSLTDGLLQILWPCTGSFLLALLQALAKHLGSSSSSSGSKQDMSCQTCDGQPGSVQDISLKMQQLENQYLTKVAQEKLKPQVALEQQMEKYKKV
jgi:hypothetical protein